MHVPPVNSTYTVKHRDQFDNLETDITSFAALGNIVLCGDFNARSD